MMQSSVSHTLLALMFYWSHNQICYLKANFNEFYVTQTAFGTDMSLNLHKDRLNSMVCSVVSCVTTNYVLLHLLIVGWDSVIGIATHYRLDGPGIESRCWQGFLHPSRLAMGLTQSHIQSVPGPFPRGRVAGV